MRSSQGWEEGGGELIGPTPNPQPGGPGAVLCPASPLLPTTR